MRTCDVSLLAGASPTYASVLRLRDQLPFYAQGRDITPSAAFLVAVQRELMTFGATTDEACDMVVAITDEMRTRWGAISSDKQPLWLIVTYDTARLVSTTEATRMLSRALHNGSHQRWPISLNNVLRKICDRASARGIDLPPPHDVKAWWGE